MDSNKVVKIRIIKDGDDPCGRGKLIAIKKDGRHREIKCTADIAKKRVDSGLAEYVNKEDQKPKTK